MNMNIHICDDYDKLSEKCAELISEQINGKLDSIMGFATGGTPVGTYKYLIAAHRAGKLDFSEITAFNLDEYYPIKKENTQSYAYFMMENLFKHVNVNTARLNIPNGEAADAEKECLDYEQKIFDAGGIDFQILGLGHNGHIGFNEPADYFTGKTNLVALQESTIEANARFFASRNDVPANAISMGIKTIMQAKKILLIASGKDKAEIIARCLCGDITPRVPGSVLQLHQNLTVVLDRDAASCLS